MNNTNRLTGQEVLDLLNKRENVIDDFQGRVVTRNKPGKYPWLDCDGKTPIGMLMCPDKEFKIKPKTEIILPAHIVDICGTGLDSTLTLSIIDRLGCESEFIIGNDFQAERGKFPDIVVLVRVKPKEPK